MDYFYLKRPLKLLRFTSYAEVSLNSTRRVSSSRTALMHSRSRFSVNKIRISPQYINNTWQRLNDTHHPPPTPKVEISVSVC